jgi:hypothetical protein
MNQLMVAIIDNVKQLRKALVPNADIAYLTAVICIVCNTNNQTAQPLFSIIINMRIWLTYYPCSAIS